MAHWLFKQEPDCYGYSQLEAEGKTVWDGVRNALAQKHLRSSAAGDTVFFYHSGKEKAIVGVMEITGPPEPLDEDPKLVSVTVKPVRKLAIPVTLAAIKADEAFAEWELVKQSRLSVMPVPQDLWERIETLASGQTPKPVVKAPAKKAAAKSTAVTQKPKKK